jgi:hypothetical protein
MEEPTSVRELFKGRHFDHEIIVLCVRRLTSSRRRIESRRHFTAPGTDPLLQVLEQRWSSKIIAG